MGRDSSWGWKKGHNKLNRGLFSIGVLLGIVCFDLVAL